MNTNLRRLARQPLTPQEWHQLTDVESLRSWATSLLTAARHDTMKDCLRSVIGDLETYLDFILRQNADDAPTLSLMTTAHARARLRLIADTFERDGPAAELKRAGEP